MPIHIKQKEIEAIDDELEEMELQYNRKRRKLEAKKEVLQCMRSVIQPGDLIEWTRSGRFYRGIVKRISPHWRDDTFELYCTILSKAGKEIGNSNVSADQQPVLVKKGRKK